MSSLHVLQYCLSWLHRRCDVVSCRLASACCFALVLDSCSVLCNCADQHAVVPVTPARGSHILPGNWRPSSEIAARLSPLGASCSCGTSHSASKWCIRENNCSSVWTDRPCYQVRHSMSLQCCRVMCTEAAIACCTEATASPPETQNDVQMLLHSTPMSG
jgi:hypothetical protein